MRAADPWDLPRRIVSKRHFAHRAGKPRALLISQLPKRRFVTPVVEQQVLQLAVAHGPQFVMVRANKRVLLVDNRLGWTDRRVCPISPLDPFSI
jgi:hypothetical protein